MNLLNFAVISKDLSILLVGENIEKNNSKKEIVPSFFGDTKTKKLEGYVY